MNSFLESAEKQLTKYKGLAEKAMQQMDDEQFFWRPNDESNSIAVLVKHIAGNMLSRFTGLLTTNGEKAWRNRDGEFEVDEYDRKALMEQWGKSWDCMFQSLKGLTVSDLEKTISVKDENITVTDGIVRALTHYADHIGQIVYIAKEQKGREWQTLSIPKKKKNDYY